MVVGGGQSGKIQVVARVWVGEDAAVGGYSTGALGSLGSNRCNW